jgi:hypothetical protein
LIFNFISFHPHLTHSKNFRSARFVSSGVSCGTLILTRAVK